jgi:hypothetical protein
MKLRYKEAGEPSPMASQKTGPKMVRLKYFFTTSEGFIIKSPTS